MPSLPQPLTVREAILWTPSHLSRKTWVRLCGQIASTQQCWGSWWTCSPSDFPSSIRSPG